MAVVKSLVALVLISVALQTFAQESKRLTMAPDDPLRKLVAQVLIRFEGAQSLFDAGDATFLGQDGCNRTLVSNFHVVFVEGFAERTNKRIIKESVQIGYSVNVRFDFDPSTGIAKKTRSARVVAMGDYDEDTTYGMGQDMVVLQMDECAGSEYGLRISKEVVRDLIPQVDLMTVSTRRLTSQRSEVVAERGCRSLNAAPISGILLNSCEAVPGMSGSAILQVREGTATLVGITTNQERKSSKMPFAAAVHAKNLSKLVLPLIGESALFVDP
jgi:hypothetical protein